MNILTIDFDILMHNNGEQYGIDKNNDELKEFYPIDFELYQQLTNVLLYFLGTHSNPEDISFIEEHHLIIPLVEEYKKQNDEDIYLINVDYHHDLSYGDEWKVDFTKQANINCGTWVRYLKENNLIQNYAWVHGYSFNPGHDEEYANYFGQLIDEHYSIGEYDFENLPLYIDKIVLCHSSFWVPGYYNPLWQLWVNLASAIENYQYQVYDISN